jgi:hypothetical protein
MNYTLQNQLLEISMCKFVQFSMQKDELLFKCILDRINVCAPGYIYAIIISMIIM